MNLVTKIYFHIILVLLVFNTYYEYLVVGFRGNLYDRLQILPQLILIVGVFSYIFNKKVLKKDIWDKIYKILMINLALQLILNLMQGSIYTNLGLQELLVGLFAFILLVFPAYFAVYKLANLKPSKKPKKTK